MLVADIWSVIRIILLTSLLLFSLLATAQRKYVHGLVKDSTSLNVIKEAHIRNITSQKLAVLDAYGKFRIPVAEGDTLIISHIGFKDLVEVAKKEWFEKELIQFELESDPIFLPEVVVNDFPEYERFKQMILETEEEPELELYGMSSIPKFVEEVSEEDLQSSSIGSIAIPFDLETITKKGKEKKKMQDILTNKRSTNQAYEKFNREWVAEMTLLEGEELTDFIDFCNFNLDYLVETSVYDIHIKMMALLEDFKDERSDS